MTLNPSDDFLRRLWRMNGGDFYGPNIETGVMPEDKLLRFLRTVMTGLGAIREAERHAPETPPLPDGLTPKEAYEAFEWLRQVASDVLPGDQRQAQNALLAWHKAAGGALLPPEEGEAE